MVKKLTIIGIFKDLTQLEQYECCVDLRENLFNNITFIDNQIKTRVTEKKIKYYRQLAAQILPNNQQPR